MDRILKAMALAATMPAVSVVWAAAPGPEPRLEAALNTYVVSELHRSVQLSKTLPRIEKPRRPAVGEGEAVRVGEDVYVDRRLLPDKGAAQDENAVRIFRRDAR